MVKIQITGLQEIKYVKNCLKNADEGFAEYKEISTKHTLFGVLNDDNRTRIRIKLEASDGECPSGYCLSTYANISIKILKKFGLYTHVPKKKLEINLKFDLGKLMGDKELKTYDIKGSDEEDDINNAAFDFSPYGDDNYYPTGHYEIKFNAFEKTNRFKEYRLVYIFKGPSGVGKSFLASKIGLMIYETDSSEKLPDVIYAGVIVLGNRNKFDIENVKSKVFGPAEIIICDFSSVGIVNKDNIKIEPLKPSVGIVNKDKTKIEPLKLPKIIKK